MFDVEACRREFPALAARPQSIFLDGPGGTQVPRRVIDALTDYLTRCNANHAGCFATSRESDAVIAEAHRAAADLLNAPAPEEIVFGQNMTTLTWHLSHALRRTLEPGDEIIVSELDHDANISPWASAAREAGAVCHRIPIRLDDCTLDLAAYRQLLGKRTRLVAVGCASNAVGTINDVRDVARLAHAAGALVFLDAVHYAPHGIIDVQAWDCDFLACSAYKFFGPHVGVLWGRRALLEKLLPDKVRPASNALPDKWMTGTQNHEGLAGLTAAVHYLADLGAKLAPTASTRRERLVAALEAIRAYEAGLARQLLDGLAARPGFTVWGIADPARLHERCPTIAVTHQEASPERLAEHLASQDIFSWNGNMYALALCERLGLEEKGGLLRLGIVHYNTAAEIDRLLRSLDTI